MQGLVIIRDHYRVPTSHKPQLYCADHIHTSHPVMLNSMYALPPQEEKQQLKLNIFEQLI